MYYNNQHILSNNKLVCETASNVTSGQWNSLIHPIYALKILFIIPYLYQMKFLIWGTFNFHSLKALYKDLYNLFVY